MHPCLCQPGHIQVPSESLHFKTEVDVNQPAPCDPGTQGLPGPCAQPSGLECQPKGYLTLTARFAFTTIGNVWGKALLLLHVGTCK